MKSRSRGLALLLTAALVGTMTPTSGLNVYAAGGTSADGLTAADSIAADVNGIKFTHQEWTGNDYTDVDGTQVGRGRMYSGSTVRMHRRRSFLISPQSRRQQQCGITMPGRTQRIYNF